MTVFRQLNYPHVAPGPDRIRASQHTDYGVLTILAQDNVGGLQVKLPGQEWEDASTPQGCLLVNIGTGINNMEISAEFVYEVRSESTLFVGTRLLLL